MPNCLDALDRYGTAVRCTTDRWIRHILGEHPELIDHLDWVDETITSPDGILQSASDGDTKICYKEYDFGPALGVAYLRVVVKYTKKKGADRIGTVVTAFAQSDTPSKVGERQSWP